MSSEPGEGISLPEGVSGQSKENDKSPQAVMMSAIARHNEMREKMSSWKVHISDRTRFDLQLSDPGVNNQLAVAAINTERDPVTGNEVGGTSFVHVGHYDPGMQRFLFYPELLHEDEAGALEQLAKDKRAAAVREHPKFDYDADIIQDLHRRHRGVLLEDGLIYKIAERYKDLSPKEKLAGTQEYLIDDSTSLHVCLTPKLGGYDKSNPSSAQAANLFMTDEAFVSIALHGDLLRDKSGVMQRKAGSYLHIGARDLDDPHGKYAPNRKLVTDDEFNKVLGLTSELQHLKATTLPNLDTAMVALKLK